MEHMKRKAAITEGKDITVNVSLPERKAKNQAQRHPMRFLSLLYPSETIASKNLTGEQVHDLALRAMSQAFADTGCDGQGFQYVFQKHAKGVLLNGYSKVLDPIQAKSCRALSPKEVNDLLISSVKAAEA